MTAAIHFCIPGRVCLLGEHSDWAGAHRASNPTLTPGLCLAYGTSCGLHARAMFAAEEKEGEDTAVLRLASLSPQLSDSVELPLKEEAALLRIAADGGHFSYVAGTAAALVRAFPGRFVRSVIIDNYKTDLPVKKGLSSSAAACVMVVRAFNLLYELGLSAESEMNLAYIGERLTPSKCGRLDQCVAFGTRPVVLRFDAPGDGDDDHGVTAEALSLPPGVSLHFVVADLCARKDTRRILADLAAAFPVAETDEHHAAQRFLGPVSHALTTRAKEEIARGDAVALGRTLSEYQAEFTKALMPLCPSELAAPRLWAVLSDPEVTALSLGGKGVGSGGDGAAQFLCADAESQARLCEVLQAKGCVPFPFTLTG